MLLSFDAEYKFESAINRELAVGMVKGAFRLGTGSTRSTAWNGPDRSGEVE
jgi:hypothetical protein